MAEKKPVNELTFEEALSEMSAIVEKMRSGEFTLEESVSAYSRGAALSARCEALLTRAQGVIETLQANGQMAPLTDTDLTEEGTR